MAEILPRRHRRPRPVHRDRSLAVRRRWTVLLAAALAVAAGAGGAVSVGRPGPGPAPLVAGAAASAPGAVDVSPLPGSPPAATPTSDASDTAPVLQVAGPVPAAGKGSFGYDDRPGPTLGRAGRVQRYRVAVEHGSGEDVRDFSDQVQVALAGPGSWVDSGELRLRRVPPGPGQAFDFTVYLTTAETAGRMCLAGGVNIRVGGRPYTSCRAPGKVIVNLDRWRRSVPHYVRAGVPLSRYRLYVINHEVGHQLGHGHERCPGRGRPAPVMQQQTLFLDGCTANPWPYLGGRRYRGRAL
ncbi:DUF3152 domain-containing protein [Micromonospora sp. KC723]|uniref:DUF3152 domain-containing protein n=1 Tax=Micromonospora sp. KC723 TaxID=2530381 RepID=UPI001043D624|nr:DUF3152 domain-containing protein [Micromonospora sp. KC723]TDB75921.1 DUF3152 domain-containing protein [Micromonospora sp. KC723]